MQSPSSVAPDGEAWSSFGADQPLDIAPTTPSASVAAHDASPDEHAFDSPSDLINVAFLKAQLAVAVERATAAELQVAAMHEQLQHEISSCENSFEREALVKAQLRMAIGRIDDLSHEVTSRKRMGLNLMPAAGKRLVSNVAKRVRASLDSAVHGSGSATAREGTSTRRAANAPLPPQQAPSLRSAVSHSQAASGGIASLGSRRGARLSGVDSPSSHDDSSTHRIVPLTGSLFRDRSLDAEPATAATVAVDAAMSAAAQLQRSGAERQYTQVCGASKMRPCAVVSPICVVTHDLLPPRLSHLSSAPRRCLLRW
jgi:hypothetical protein